MSVIEIKIKGMSPTVLNSLLYFVSINTLYYEYTLFKTKIKFKVSVNDNKSLDSLKDKIQDEYNKLYR